MGIVSAIAGIGSALIGANSARKQAKSQESANEKAIEASLMGFNYLKDNPIVGQAQQQGMAAGTRLNEGLAADGAYAQAIGPGGLYGALLGLGGDTEAAQQAFDNYRDSTGYQFRLDQGLGAITGGAASRGLLNSGATARALQGYGQNLASQEFGNYLGQIQTYAGGLGDYLTALQGQQQTGLNAAFNVASSGSSAGATAAGIGQRGAAAVNDIRQQGTNNIVSGLGAAAGGLTDWWANRKVA